MDKKTILRDDMLENVSGGSGLVLPDYMKAMTEEQVGEVLKDPDFIGTPEWEELMELNPQRKTEQATETAGNHNIH